ncbi:MAG TPA: nucleotide exchange factor GrpE [Phycisphaerae bacterium]|nr:nucleotide exchange factor GrpE [Phycisphaerae bacterium]HPP27530.1 nucleotide exchange factor GrpE [Phycisphaerae bacterium]
MATKKTTAKKTTPSTTEGKAAGTAASKQAAAKAAAVRTAKSTADTKKATKPKKSAKSSVDAGIEVADSSPAAILARAEADMARLLESLNTQMTAVMHAFEELAAVQRGGHEAIIRTKPIDRATAMFQRLVSEIVDDRFAEFLPTLVALRDEMEQRNRAEGDGVESVHGEFFARGTEMLDQVLRSAEVQAYTPNVGDAYDPLIHLAVGETFRDDLPGDVVAEAIQHGFRTVRGKVIQPARVKVNRR